MKSLYVTAIAIFMTSSVSAADLGVWGDLYPVEEQDMLSVINQRLTAMEKSGELAQKQEEFTNRVKENTLRPPPVKGIGKANESRTHYFDPSFVVSKDIADNKGNIFAIKGTKHNPLESIPFNHTLYFINGDDLEQVEWMKRQKPKTIQYSIVLVNGNIKTATEALSARIFFDQNGVMTSKFGITEVPARVTLAEDRLRLRVDTINPEDDK